MTQVMKWLITFPLQQNLIGDGESRLDDGDLRHGASVGQLVLQDANLLCFASLHLSSTS